MQVIVVPMFVIALTAMLVAAVDGRLPDTFENELAFGERDFAADHWVVFLELTDDLVLLLWGQFGQLLQDFALVLLWETLFLRSSIALRRLCPRVGAEPSHRHIIKVTQVVLSTDIATKHILRFLDSLLGLIHRDVLASHKIVVDANTLLGEQLGVGPESRLDFGKEAYSIEIYFKRPNSRFLNLDPLHLAPSRGWRRTQVEVPLSYCVHVIRGLVRRIGPGDGHGLKHVEGEEACAAVHVGVGQGGFDGGLDHLCRFQVLCLVVARVPCVLRAVAAVLDGERGFHVR